MSVYPPQTWTNGLAGGTPLSAARLQYIEDGISSLGVWTTYVPTYGNFTLGNGVVTARYTQVGKTVSFYVRVVLGSTSAVSGAIQVSLPVTGAYPFWNAYGLLVDTGSQFYPTVALSTTSVVELYASSAAATYVVPVNTSATVPFTWTTSDVIYVSGVYEAA